MEINSHVTSPPGLFPRHPPFEGLLKPAFISQRQNEEPPNIRDTSGISGNVFAHPQTSSSAPYPQELNSTWRKTIEEPIHMSTTEKSERQEQDQDLRSILDRQPKIQSSSVEETLQRIMEQTNNDCRFRIFISTNSLHQLRLLEDKIQDRGMYLFTIPHGSYAMNGSKKWRWLIQWMI